MPALFTPAITALGRRTDFTPQSERESASHAALLAAGTLYRRIDHRPEVTAAAKGDAIRVSCIPV